MYGIEGRQSALLFVGKDNVFNEYPPNPVGIFGRLLRKSQFLSVCLRYGLQPGGKLMVECYKVFAERVLDGGEGGEALFELGGGQACGEFAAVGGGDGAGLLAHHYGESIGGLRDAQRRAVAQPQ